MKLLTENELKNGSKVMVKNLSDNLQAFSATIVGVATYIGAAGMTMFIVRPDEQIGDYECIVVPNCCIELQKN